MARPILVVDLEATCWEGQQEIADMEVIEFGCVVVAGDGSVEREFSTFVRPVKSPTLTQFCTDLTSITQEDVEAAPEFRGACARIDEWLGSTRGLIWGSWGYYDEKQLRVEGERHGVAPAFLDVPHVNLKKLWQKTQKCKPAGLRGALRYHGLDFQGSPHRGIDDARNIARLLPNISRDRINAAVDAWRACGAAERTAGGAGRLGPGHLYRGPGSVHAAPAFG